MQSTDLKPVLRVVFLSAQSGGGHNGTAQAFAQWLEVTFSQPVETQIIDIYGHTLKALPWLSRIRNHSNFLWKIFFNFTEHAWILQLSRRILKKRMIKTVLQQIKTSPDLLVAVHFCAAQCIDAIAQQLTKNPRTLTIATDYFPHRAWFGDADLTVVSAPLGLARAHQFHTQSGRLMGVSLLPCRPFLAKNDFRSHPRFIKIVAVMGADGTSGAHLIKLLRALNHTPFGKQISIDVICGNNQKLQHEISELASEFAQLARNLRVHSLGFVNDLSERFANADLALLRASPLVLTEALNAGVPVIAFDWHAHEAANTSLLKEWGCGYASQSIPETIKVLKRCVDERRHLVNWRYQAQKVSKQGFGQAQIEQIFKQLAI